MKLIEALIIAHQKYAIYQSWHVQHTGGARIDKTGSDNGWYYAYAPDNTLVSQSIHLEPVLANLAERYPDVVLSEEWKVSHLSESAVPTSKKVMGWQEIISNAVAVERANQLKTSEQLVLGELILKLEAIEDKRKPIVFDEQYHPSGVDSWRGSYDELAIEYEETGKVLSAEELLSKLKDAIGTTFYGYKGGEFVMGKTTPVWVANYGNSSGFLGDTQAVVNVSENVQAVIIETKGIDY